MTMVAMSTLGHARASYERRAWGEAFAYSLGSVMLSVVALFAGLLLMRRVLA